MASYFSQIYHVRELLYVLWAGRTKGQRGQQRISPWALSVQKGMSVLSLQGGKDLKHTEVKFTLLTRPLSRGSW